MKKIALGLVALSALSTAALAGGNDRSWDAFDIRKGTTHSSWTANDGAVQNEGLKVNASGSAANGYFQAPGYTNDSK